MPNDTFTCPVCGYPNLDEPPVDNYGCSTYSICPCCGVEFGYDDSSRSHGELRREWVAKGAVWFSKDSAPPDGWDAIKQLQSAGLAE